MEKANDVTKNNQDVTLPSLTGAAEPAAIEPGQDKKPEILIRDPDSTGIDINADKTRQEDLHLDQNNVTTEL